MAELDPTTPQVVDPERTVDLTRLLQIRGPLGVLNVLDTIVPVVNMGDVVTRNVTILQPSFRSSDVFSNGLLAGAVANTVFAATGPLAGGVYDVQLYVALNATDPMAWKIQHENATNTATLARWHVIGINTAGVPLHQVMAYELADNEQLRIINISNFTVGVTGTAWIFARRRT